MTQAQTAPNPISEAALQVYSKEELQALSPVSRTNLGIMINRRLQEGTPPTVAELQGIKKLAMTVFNHPAFKEPPKEYPTSMKANWRR